MQAAKHSPCQENTWEIQLTWLLDPRNMEKVSNLSASKDALALVKMEGLRSLNPPATMA